MSADPAPVWVWRKFSKDPGFESWAESRFPGFLSRRVVTQTPRTNSLRFDLYPSELREGKHLRKLLGGRVIRLSGAQWWAPQKERERPLKIGSRLMISTRLSRATQSSRVKYLVIPQGLAFGSGTHATTRMCLQELVRLREKGVSTLLDIGTGTGILAIAAAMLGSSKVFGVDNDPVAIRVARENAVTNGVKLRWKVEGLDSHFRPGHFQWVTANLYSELLIRFAGVIARCVETGGRLILSGIRSDQVGGVKRVYGKVGLGLRLERERKINGWCCLVYFRPSTLRGQGP